MWGVLGIFSLYLPGVGKWLFSMTALGVVVFSAVGILSVVLNRAWKLPFVHSIAAMI